MKDVIRIILDGLSEAIKRRLVPISLNCSAMLDLLFA
jgi:hypothetical protein